MRRRVLLAAPLLAAPRAHAFATRPVRIVVPYAPGGGTDSFTRILADGLAAELGHPVLVENRPGANGVVGSEAVARAQPDGHTLLVVVSAHIINRHVMRSLPYDPLADFTPVMRLCRTVTVLVAGPQAGFASIADMLAAARARPGTVSVGHSEAATAYAGNLVARLAGVTLLPVPYRGGGPMMTDLIAGTVMTAVTSSGSAIGHLRAGRIRALGITPARRATTLPEIPTIAEAGIPGYDYSGWYGLFGPARLPAEITAALNGAIARVMAREPLRGRLAALGGELDPLDHAGFSALLVEEDARWARAAAEGTIATE